MRHPGRPVCATANARRSSNHTSSRRHRLTRRAPRRQRGWPVLNSSARARSLAAGNVIRGNEPATPWPYPEGELGSTLRGCHAVRAVAAIGGRICASACAARAPSCRSRVKRGAESGSRPVLLLERARAMQTTARSVRQRTDAICVVNINLPMNLLRVPPMSDRPRFSGGRFGRSTAVAA